MLRGKVESNMQVKLETLKTIFTHKYWVAATLAGAFFSFFALNRGGVLVFIHATFIFLVLNVATGRYRFKSIPSAYWVMSVICTYFIMVSRICHPNK